MKILVVDGSKKFSENLIRYLGLENDFDEVFEADAVEEALRIIKANSLDVIIFDIQLKGESGLDIVPVSRRMPWRPVLIVCSNYWYPQYKSIYENMDVNYFFDKSSQLAELKTFIKKIIMDRQNYV